MKIANIPLYNFNNGTFMIIVFAVVCVALVAALFLFLGTAPKKNEENEENKE
ncbi:MAG: hypothetical protein LBI72_14660 [Flavobacteriaceae bacterium]|jgi:uncharacterized membrane protein|nr:hypothetical protein [Flavobacteriaceae bacterium]